MCGKVQVSDLKEMFAETTEGGSIGVAGMRLLQLLGLLIIGGSVGLCIAVCKIGCIEC